MFCIVHGISFQNVSFVTNYCFVCSYKVTVFWLYVNSFWFIIIFIFIWNFFLYKIKRCHILLWHLFLFSDQYFLSTKGKTIMSDLFFFHSFCKQLCIIMFFFYLLSIKQIFHDNFNIRITLPALSLIDLKSWFPTDITCCMWFLFYLPQCFFT